MNTWPIIYYLLHHSSINAEYLELHQEFKRYQLQLVPVTFDQFQDLAKNQRGIITLFLEQSFAQRKWFGRILERHLRFQMQSRKLTLFHLSSFGPHLPLGKFASQGQYRYLPLPVKISSVLAKLAEDLLKRWPGGKRVALPPMVSRGSK